MISGEIKRFLRDDGMIKVSRTLKELSYKIFQTREKLLDLLGREPTIEELAEKMNVDKETLKATVNRYNELCDKGVDEDFNKPGEYMQKIEGKVYAIPLSRSYTVTFDGLVTDLDSHVLDENNKPIQGLYAAGEVAFTGLFGDEYQSCGLAIGASVRYGRIAGINAAAGK